MFNNSSRQSALHWSGAILLSFAAVVIVLVAVSFAAGNSESKPDGSHLQTVSIPVEGMSCMSCAARVKQTLKRIEGVQHVEVSLEHREAVVRFLPEKVSPERLKSAVDALGYKAGTPRVVEAK